MAAPPDAPTTIRVATMNVSLYGDTAGEVADRLAAPHDIAMTDPAVNDPAADFGTDAQSIRLARIIRTLRPDILLLCEIDHDAHGTALNRFADNFLNAKRNVPTDPIDYPHRWSIPTNTGLLADIDLDRDGDTELPGDAWGFGKYPGQYAMAILSRYPIDRDRIRSFQTYLWSDLPGALRPIDPRSNAPYHPDAVWQRLRLSSKNHVDVPILIPQSGAAARAFHLLASHPTPPVFDGPEDRNGRRNHDEIRFWRDYISTPDADYLRDDNATRGGLPIRAPFVIAGDLNSDPIRGDSRHEAIIDLLACDRLQDVAPESESHGTATALFGTRQLRVDYVLPSANCHVQDSGVVWPQTDTPLGRCLDATDHRMVWIDLQLPTPVVGQ